MDNYFLCYRLSEYMLPDKTPFSLIPQILNVRKHGIILLLLGFLYLIIFSKLTHSLEVEGRLKSQKFNEANTAQKSENINDQVKAKLLQCFNYLLAWKMIRKTSKRKKKQEKRTSRT